MADHRGPGAALPAVVARALQRYLVEQEALVRDMWRLFEAPIDMGADGGRESRATTMREVLERVVDNLDTDYCLVRGNREFFESVSAASFAADRERPPQHQLMPPPPPPERPGRSVPRQRRPVAVGPQSPINRRRRRPVPQPPLDRQQHRAPPPPLSMQLMQQLDLQWVPPSLWLQHVQRQRLIGQQLHAVPSPVGPAAAIVDVPGCQ